MSVADKPKAYPMDVYGTGYSKDEANLLLYLETRAVDYGGGVAGIHMNDVDFSIAKGWADDGFLVVFGRIPFDQIKKTGLTTSTYYVELSGIAHQQAALLRQRRAERTKRELRSAGIKPDPKPKRKAKKSQ